MHIISKQTAKQIIKPKNIGDEMRQAEQVQWQMTWTPTLDLQVFVITIIILVIDTAYLTIRTKIINTLNFSD